MNIDRHNYEEFFILYLDNELSDADRLKVEGFAQANPDLQEELDLLLQSRFSPDMEVQFSNKEELMKLPVEGMDHTNYEQWLLLYTDNELNDDQKKAVDNFVATNPEIGKELAIFQQTRLTPDTAIIFENKELLYRHETKTRKIGFAYWRVAAAVTLLVGLSASVFMLVESKKQQEQENGLATNDSPSKIKPPIPSPVVNNPATGNTIALATDTNSENTEDDNNETAVAQNHQTADVVKASKINAGNTPAVITAETIENPVATNRNNPVSTVKVEDNKVIHPNFETNLSNPIAMNVPLTDPKRNNQIAAVTTENASSSDIQTPDPLSPDDVAGINQSGKKNKFRGFFRKVTRTIEKTTNMKATDEDDRLLLAGLAIKL